MSKMVNLDPYEKNDNFDPQRHSGDFVLRDDP